MMVVLSIVEVMMMMMMMMNHHHDHHHHLGVSASVRWGSNLLLPSHQVVPLHEATEVEEEEEKGGGRRRRPCHHQQSSPDPSYGRRGGSSSPLLLPFLSGREEDNMRRWYDDTFPIPLQLPQTLSPSQWPVQGGKGGREI